MQRQSAYRTSSRVQGRFFIYKESPIPIFSIIELLVRISEHNAQIGTYVNHIICEDTIEIETTKGAVSVPLEIVFQQKESPESISETELKLIALSASV